MRAGTAHTAHTDTIAAIASAPGAAGVGIVRVSGPLVATIATLLLGRKPTPRYAHVAAFRDEQANIIDRGVLLHFVGPASYTGEDVLELQGHGSPVVLDALLHRVCTLGARLARPGEFTERAFLNGKLDLAQAEAVADLIAARSHSAARAALQSMEGIFSRKVGDVLNALVELRVHIEAAIDFPEEEIDFLADPVLVQRSDHLRTQLTQLLREAQRGLRLNDGLRVAIIGRPNAGKSSLLNALAGSDRAIVTPIAGTTRDVLRESINLDGMVLELADTAGMRDTHDVVEREGVLRAQRELERADAVVLVTDAQHASIDLDLITGLPASVRRLVLVNKIDLENETARASTEQHVTWLWASAKTGEGLDRLREQLKKWAGASDLEGAFTARRRHVVALERVTAYVDRASLLLKETRQGELAAEELRQAQHVLGEITGDYTSDDLLGAIFGSFCIGK